MNARALGILIVAGSCVGAAPAARSSERPVAFEGAVSVFSTAAARTAAPDPYERYSPVDVRYVLVPDPLGPYPEEGDPEVPRLIYAPRPNVKEVKGPAGTTDYVRAQVCFDTHGRTQSWETDGRFELEQEVDATVVKWRARPALRDGAAVEGCLTAVFIFERLERSARGFGPRSSPTELALTWNQVRRLRPPRPDPAEPHARPIPLTALPALRPDPLTAKKLLTSASPTQVKVHLCVDVVGDPHSITADRPGSWATAVVEAVERWRFAPALDEGKAVERCMVERFVIYPTPHDAGFAPEAPASTLPSP